MAKTRCVRCVSDSSIPGIHFDSSGVCNYCHAHDRLEQRFPLGPAGESSLNQLVEEMRKAGKHGKYDCVIGVSGGTDSSYTLHMASKLGLRTLAIHFDNGYDGQIAIENIRKVTAQLGIELRNVSTDLDEFRDLQIAFLRASVPDAEIPTDIAYRSVLYKIAAAEGIRFVLTGHSFRVEGFSPKGWTHMDGRYIKDVYREHGKKRRLKSYPNFLIKDLLYYGALRRIQWIPFMSYFDYQKEAVKEMLAETYDWEYYGGHHYESDYTRFVIDNLLWDKFGIDKRIIELSAYVRSGMTAREDALRQLEQPINVSQELAESCAKTLGLTSSEMSELMKLPPRSFHDYRSYYNWIRMLRIPIRIAVATKIVPYIFYEKYFSGD